MAFTSASVLLRQVSFGLPTFRFPCGFQSNCLVTCEGDFLSVWPIHPHFLFPDLHFNGAFTSLVPEVDDVSEASVDKGLQFVGVWLGSSPCFEAIQQDRLDVVLKILILLWRERSEEYQLGRSVFNACVALLIRLLMSSSVPPFLLSTLPR